MKNEQILFFFEKLKKAHPIYVRASEQKKREILAAYDYIFTELEKLGVPKSFSESLLIWEKEFVDSFKDIQMTNQEGKTFHPSILTAEKVVKNAVDPKPPTVIGLFEQPVEAELISEGMVTGIEPEITVNEKISKRSGSVVFFKPRVDTPPQTFSQTDSGHTVDQGVSDQVAMAEDVFGVKARDMTDIEKREFALVCSRVNSVFDLGTASTKKPEYICAIMLVEPLARCADVLTTPWAGLLA